MSGIDHLAGHSRSSGRPPTIRLTIEGVQRDALRALEGFAAGPHEALAVEGTVLSARSITTRCSVVGMSGIEPQVGGALEIGHRIHDYQRVDRAVVKAVGIARGNVVGEIIRGEDGACGERRNLHAVGLQVRIHGVPGQHKPMPEAASQDARLEHLSHDLHRIDRLLLSLGREPAHESGRREP